MLWFCSSFKITLDTYIFSLLQTSLIIQNLASRYLIQKLCAKDKLITFFRCIYWLHVWIFNFVETYPTHVYWKIVRLFNGFFEKSLRISTFCVCPTRNQILSGIIHFRMCFVYNDPQHNASSIKITESPLYFQHLRTLSAKYYLVCLTLATWYPLILIIGYQIALCEQFLSNDQRFQVLRIFIVPLHANKTLTLKCYNLHFWKYFKWQCI